MRTVLLVGIALTVASPAFATIEGLTTFSVHLVKDKQPANKLAWGDPKQFEIDADGLGWGKKGDNGSRDFWLQTEPIALGLSWRPTAHASIRAKLAGTLHDGSLYVRYSADRKHWTTWQILTNDDKDAGSFSGVVSVTNRDRNKYWEIQSTFRNRKDVPWCCDEEAFARELTKKDAAFFLKFTPYIGYTQFLYETRLHGGDRVESIKIDMGWSVSGKHVPPADPKLQQGRDGPWRFKI